MKTENKIFLAYNKESKELCLVKIYKKTTLALTQSFFYSKYSLLTIFNEESYIIPQKFKNKLRIINEVEILFSDDIKNFLINIKDNLEDEILQLLRSTKKKNFYKSISTFLSKLNF